LAAPDNPNPETKTGFRLEGPPPSEELRTGYQPPPNISDFLRKHHAETANKLAVWLLAILGGSVLLHYTCVMILILCKRDDATKVLEDLFHSWLPVLAGLAGSAATYYFTKAGNGK
jgi:hypothetical protein